MRSTVLLLVLAAGSCREPESTPNPPARVDIDRVPVPNHSPQDLREPGEPRRVGLRGMMDANLAGRRQHFTFFPRGRNVAAHFPKTGVSYIRLEGALDDEGRPALTFALEGYRLRHDALPASFVAGPRSEGPELHVYFVTGDLARWSTKHPGENPIQLTLESLDGHTLRGRFEGVLPPAPGNDSPAIHMDHGMFAIDIRLQNVLPGPEERAP